MGKDAKKTANVLATLARNDKARRNRYALSHKLVSVSAIVAAATVIFSGGALAQPAKPVAPGTIVVHFNGYLQFEIAAYGSTFNTYDGDKLNPVSTDGDVRLYPGFDAQTLSGVDYGVQIETRTTTSNAGRAAGNNSTSTAGTSSIYIRRAYGYVGTPTYGFARFGQGDGPFTLFENGTMQAYGDGAQYGSDGGPSQIPPSNAVPLNFIYGNTGPLYSTDKVVYLTPAYAGWSGGFGYEPNSNGLRQGYANNTTASSTSAALTTSTSSTDEGTRRRNTVDAAVQYALKSDGFVWKTSAAYLTGATIAYDGTTPIAAAPHGYDNLSVYQFGTQLTAGRLSVGANVKGGQVEDSYNFKPKGARDGLTYLVGAIYTVGPYVLGASYFNAQTSGSYAPGSTSAAKEAKTLTEYGVAVGGNYVIGKDLSLFVQYLYGHRHQPGNTALLAGNAQDQLIALGATAKW